MLEDIIGALDLVFAWADAAGMSAKYQPVLLRLWISFL